MKRRFIITVDIEEVIDVKEEVVKKKKGTTKTRKDSDIPEGWNDEPDSKKLGKIKRREGKPREGMIVKSVEYTRPNVGIGHFLRVRIIWDSAYWSIEAVYEKVIEHFPAMTVKDLTRFLRTGHETWGAIDCTKNDKYYWVGIDLKLQERYATENPITSTPRERAERKQKKDEQGKRMK